MRIYISMDLALLLNERWLNQYLTIGDMHLLTNVSSELESLIPSLIPNNSIITAAKTNNTKTVVWVRNLGFDWDPVVALYAAMAGNLKLLQWLVDNDCPWEPYKAYHISMHREIRRWISEEGYYVATINWLQISKQKRKFTANDNQGMNLDY